MSAISEVIGGSGRRMWLLSTLSTSYGVALGGDGAPVNVHWGRSLTASELIGLEQPDRLPDNSFDGPYDGWEELAVDGGARFGPASLQVRFADGTRAIEWAFTGSEILGGTTLRLDFTDRHYPLGIALYYRVTPETDVVERWVELVNTGDDEDISLLRADSAAWSLPARPAYRLSHVIGKWCGESRLRRGELATAETVLTSRRGVSSHHANPWVMVDAGDAGEDHGEVWSTALAWSGSWRITVARDSADKVAVTGGFGHDGVHWKLAPGKTLRTPVFAGLYSAHGFGGASRSWHDYALRDVLPHADELRPVLYNSWEATGFDVDEPGQLKLAGHAAGLGAELFVMDDGWFGRRLSDHAGLGDWQVNPERFPDGLKPLVEEVHRLGMKFGLWVEPEMVNPDSDLYRAHPDWVLHQANRRRTELRNQLVLNFADPEVAEWAFDWLNALVGDHGIDFLKWDMNRAFSEAGWPSNTEDPESLWIGHTRAVYAIMDRLRAEHPGLRIESCSGGGGRIDFGALARTDQVWTSDNTDAYDRLLIQEGYSQVYPARAMAAWVTDNPHFLTGRSIPLAFRFHVAMTGVLGIGGDVTKWSDDELAYARTQIALYKDIRPVVQHGKLYRSGQGVTQYVSAGSERAVVFVFVPTRHFGRAQPPVRLTGLDAAARYRDEDSGAEYTGAVLAVQGLSVELPEGDYASALVRLRRI
ncbi:alpha-galactosidase [Amycolatopsis sp.]|jgi:alpha-galactosidase|uniref:alpha-galactosidase n=1 Tax=Amycolatopsis sp. TaxID=37632 RepID=UPI002DFE6788|nr:alpha-galactosidase [Amycolatopsis sp.]